MASAATESSRRRRVGLALSIYVACTVVFFASATRARITEHTPFNHYALLADSWLHGRLDLGHAPPPYTENNDFASFGGKWFVSFPPFPAVLLLPLAKIAGSPENLRDGQFWLWLAGVGPATLFLVLEKLRRTGKSATTELESYALALLFAFGTVYYFTAEQGTVWFAAHVVAVALSALYVLFALDAERPVLAGLALGLLFATRPPMTLLAPLFAIEAVRVSVRDPAVLAAPTPRGVAGALDARALAKRLALFALPVAAVLAITFWHNHARFGRVLEFGHALLTVGWRGRIERWGLFSYHYFARNLGVMLTSLPYLNQVPSRVQVNAHGLALWVTTPAYLWLLWPRRTGWVFWALALAALPVVVADLCYQNSGWIQFGYRFSNDYAVLLFAMLAVAGLRLGKRFWALAAFAVAVNTFGALTFDRRPQFYFTDPTQKTLYQPD